MTTPRTLDEAVAAASADDGSHEKRIWGPPGTGKTTTISAMVRDAAQALGSANVMVASFTVTAAAELASRGLALPKQNIGTLHSHALKSLDGANVANKADFNADHPAYQLSVDGRSSGASLDGETPVASTGGATEADALLAAADTLRNQLVPVEEWPSDVARFHDTWSTWKRQNNVVDFTDMIEFARRDTTFPNSQAQVMFFDEVQDQTPLELSLIWHWGKSANRIVLAGDDDQMIYGFRGADAKVWRDRPIPEQDRIILGQSHRVPASVHRAASRWIKRVSWREDKPYDPRAVEGECVMKPLRWNDPVPLANAVEAEVEAGREVMVLAACGYLLDPVKHALRERGLPFHNPYTDKRKDWNPLGPATPGTVSARDRLLSYLVPDEEQFSGLDVMDPEQAAWRSRLWTGDDVRRWFGAITSRGVFRQGAKALVADLPRETLDQGHMEALLHPDVSEETLDRIFGPDLSWFVERLNATSKASGSMQFAVQVAKQRGARALVTRPRVKLGTIHSVKGGQADTVFLIPDLSVKGYAQFAQAGPDRDGVIRQFYVGQTRAKERLYVCEPGGKAYVPPLRLVESAA